MCGFADGRSMDISSIALQGVLAADNQLQDAATQLATFGADTPAGAGVDVVDLSAAALALVSAKTQFAANVGTLRVADSIRSNALNVLA
jgi:hypothetical protein